MPQRPARGRRRNWFPRCRCVPGRYRPSLGEGDRISVPLDLGLGFDLVARSTIGGPKLGWSYTRQARPTLLNTSANGATHSFMPAKPCVITTNRTMPCAGSSRWSHLARSLRHCEFDIDAHRDSLPLVPSCNQSTARVICCRRLPPPTRPQDSGARPPRVRLIYATAARVVASLLSQRIKRSPTTPNPPAVANDSTARSNKIARISRQAQERCHMPTPQFYFAASRYPAAAWYRSRCSTHGS